MCVSVCGQQVSFIHLCMTAIYSFIANENYAVWLKLSQNSTAHVDSHLSKTNSTPELAFLKVVV